MNDLVLLRYGWGHSPGDGSGMTDCFQLCCEARRRLALRDFTETFAWVYDQWNEATFPRRNLLRWLLEHGHRLTGPRHGAVALLPSPGGMALGTCIENRVLCIGPRQNVIQAPIPVGIARYFWMDS
jgi:hypothetical protein